LQYTNTSWTLQFKPPPSICVIAAAAAVQMIHVKPRLSGMSAGECEEQ
jgi:hypothetical protein